MATKKSTPQSRFKDNMIDMIEFCRTMVVDLTKRKYSVVNPKLIEIGGAYLKENFDDISLIEGFIFRSVKHWDKIKDRDENFFIQHSNAIFGEKIPIDIIKMFTNLFTMKDNTGKPVLHQDDRDIIWEYFESFVRISIKFVHEKRRPFSTEKEKVVTDPETGETKTIKVVVPEYETKAGTSDINLVVLAKRWNVELLYPRI